MNIIRYWRIPNLFFKTKTMWTVIKYVFWIILIILLIWSFIQDEIQDWDKYLSYKDKEYKRKERKLRLKIFWKQCKRWIINWLKQAWNEWLSWMKDWLKKVATTRIIIYFVVAIIWCAIVWYFEYFTEK